MEESSYLFLLPHKGVTRWSTVNLFPHWCNGNYGEVWDPRSCRRCWCEPRAHRQGPGDPRLVDVFVPAIGDCWQHRHVLPPQHRLAGERAPLLLPGGIVIEREDQLADLAHPVPAPALHTEDRHHP